MKSMVTAASVTEASPFVRHDPNLKFNSKREKELEGRWVQRAVRKGGSWYARQDSNLRPTAPEAVALSS